MSEIDVYNALLGQPGDLGCVLMIEIEDESDRKRLLTSWRGLEQRLYVKLADGTRISALFDAAQVGDDRISAVQYLRFPVGGQVPVAVGVDFRGLKSEVDLNDEQITALAEDVTRT